MMTKSSAAPLVLAVLMSCTCVLMAQTTFQKTFGGPGDDRGCSCQQTTDGGYIVAGDTCLSSSWYPLDVYLVKTSRDGDIMWTRTWDMATNFDVGRCVQQTRDGGYVVCGNSGTNGFLIKTSSLGIQEWQHSYGEAYEFVRQTSDNGFILVGQVNSGDCPLRLRRLDYKGDSIWARSYDNTNSAGWKVIRATSDGGFIVSAICNAGNPYFYAKLYRFDSDGDTLWTRRFGGTGGDDYACDVRQTQDGGYVFAGYASSRGAGLSDVWLVKTDGTGNMQWERTFGTEKDDYGHSAVQTSDGGYAVAGYTKSYGAGGEDVWLIKTDESGNMVWSKTYGSSGGERCEGAGALQQTSDGGYVIVGFASLGGTNNDVYLIKTDPSGNVGGVQEENEPGLPNAQLCCQPDPFGRRTVISYALANEGEVSLRVCNAVGRVVTTLFSGRQAAGRYRVTWDATGIPGNELPTGTYFCRLEAGEYTATRKMVKTD